MPQCPLRGRHVKWIMKRFTITAATVATALGLTLFGIAHSDVRAAGKTAPQLRELLGQGSEACPAKSLCL